MTTFLIILAMPMFAVTAGMFFGRNAPFRPEYTRIG